MSEEFSQKLTKVFKSLHEQIEDAGKQFTATQEFYAVSYPPNTSLSVGEQKALVGLSLSNEAKSAFSKLFVDNCSVIIDHFLTDLDGEGVPKGLDSESWFGINILEAKFSEDPVVNEVSLSECFWEAYKELTEQKS